MHYAFLDGSFDLQESSAQLAMGAAFGITPPTQQVRRYFDANFIICTFSCESVMFQYVQLVSLNLPFNRLMSI